MGYHVSETNKLQYFANSYKVLSKFDEFIFVRLMTLGKTSGAFFKEQGIFHSNMRKWRTLESRPSDENFKKMAQVLEVPVEELVEVFDQARKEKEL